MCSDYTSNLMNGTSEYSCICVCMYVCTYVCACVPVTVHGRQTATVRASSLLQLILRRVNKATSAFVCVYMCVRIFVRICACALRICMCMFVCVCARARACVRACVCVCAALPHTKNAYDHHIVGTASWRRGVHRYFPLKQYIEDKISKH